MAETKGKGEQWEVSGNSEVIGILNSVSFAPIAFIKPPNWENAKEIVALHNAAISISDNPMAVAEGMGNLWLAAREIMADASEAESYMKLEQALTAITKPKEDKPK